MGKRLRSGFTTGACSAAAAKAAALALVTGTPPETIEIGFPDGSRKSFIVHSCTINEPSATASIIKDAGDDPDVTNKAEICATVELGHHENPESPAVNFLNIQLFRGKGVGIVTKPGLAIGVGEPAINPVPRQMIFEAVGEVTDQELSVTISVVDGELLAEKTLNKRLGILGGLSILGTTGIVRPISADAWTATISASMDVAKEAGLREIVISTGRTSEKGAQHLLQLPEEAYAEMGDYLFFALNAAREKGFTTIHYAGMWAKVMKAALQIPQTHVKNGALEVAQGAELLESLGAVPPLIDLLRKSNTAREMLTHIEATGQTDLITKVCLKAKDYAQSVAGTRVYIYLIDHQTKVITHV
ncbi:cobalt-precorrin-5B (C(1))-methyltransferase [Desulforhopalus sp. IMCC35007]|uniref:cobalt-precorrin-5B (C(1))-methyltransferase n=1 Tax=Desulforhopalus sp. IMCC35007 TaxID=2569543 RepID=UPI0010AE44F1|nr:cobalt-precorrin-5B (C(1))-methyltransferase [Desulforhopalus sp. IMCC35007]TKB07174.1 cobalt-precorrin-5B (C(1))-methyltransferase [Desulforhopalus sp. IMCC35007]